MRLCFLNDDEMKEALARKDAKIQELRQANDRLWRELAMARADAQAWEIRARRMDQLYRAMIDQSYPVEE